jgi:Fuc2NAc and GlcNAc transferase
MMMGERWFEAHRSHAYQHLARRWNSHRKVTLLVSAINLCFLFPLAWLAQREAAYSVTLLCVAYVPLAIGAIICKAGSSK